MELQKTENETFNQEGPKQNLPMRCKPGLLYRLKNEAKKLGMALGAYCESLLENFSYIEEKANKATAEVEELKKRNTLLLTELTNEKSRHQREIEELKRKNALLETTSVESSSKNKNEVEELKKQNESLASQLSIYQDERLLKLFEQVKGKTDTIHLAEGKILNIIYNHPSDVLRGLLYSFQLKK